MHFYKERKIFTQGNYKASFRPLYKFSDPETVVIEKVEKFTRVLREHFWISSSTLGNA